MIWNHARIIIHFSDGESRVAAGVQTDRSLLDALLEQKPRWLILSPSSLLKPTVRVREESLSEDDQSGQLKNITIRLGGSTTSTLSDTSDYFLWSWIITAESQDRVWESHSEDDRSDQLKKSLSDWEAVLLVRCLTHQTNISIFTKQADYIDECFTSSE